MDAAPSRQHQVGLTAERRALDSLSIVLPCYNEGFTIAAVAEAAERVGREVADVVEVIVVDDGSDDRSGEILRAMETEIPTLRCVEHGENRGYGQALRSGFRAARHRYVFYTDADGQFDFGDLHQAVLELRENDIVVGYRAIRQDSWVRRLNGRLWSYLTNRCLGLRVRDVNCAFKIFPADLFDRITLRSRGALIDAEILVKSRRLGLRIGEIPVRHHPRRGGRATGADLRVMWRAFAELFELIRQGAR